MVTILRNNGSTDLEEQLNGALGILQALIQR